MKSFNDIFLPTFYQHTRSHFAKSRFTSTVQHSGIHRVSDQ